MTLVKRSVKGAALTANEHDANLDHVLSMANMAEGANALILTPSERTRISRARQAVASVAAMTALAKSALADGDLIEVEHYYSDAPGGGGRFVWDESSTATADGGAVIAADEGGSGRWLRDFSASNYAITFEMFGAKQLEELDQEDPHDSTSAIQAAINFLPTPSAAVMDFNFRQNYRITVTGFFAISDTIQWDYINGVEMIGVSMQNYNAAGFTWIGDPDPTKSFINLVHSRYCLFKNLRLFCRILNDDPDQVMMAGFTLDGTYTSYGRGSQISERHRFERIYMGTREGSENNRIVAGTYMMKYGFLTVGSDLNNDFMDFIECRINDTVYSIYNDRSQAVGWKSRRLRSIFVDHTAYCMQSMFFEDCESNHNRGAIFEVGSFVNLSVRNHYSEETDGPFIKAVNSGSTGQIIISECELDVGRDEEQNSFMEIGTSGMISVIMDRVRLYNARKILVGSAVAAKSIKYRDSTDPEIVVGTGTGQRVFVEGSTSGIRSPSGLTDEGYRPFANLLHSINEPEIDKQRQDMPSDRVRLGNRFRGAALEIEAINVMLDEQTGGTITFEDLIPAGSLLFGVITQNIGASGATTYEVGDGTDQDRWGSVSGANMTSPGGATIADFADAGPVFVKADTSVVLTATSGAFSNATVLATALVATLKPRYYNPSNAQ